MVKFSVILLAFSLSACGFEVVNTGHRGIMVNLGEVIGEPLPEGLYFYNPFTESIKEFSVRQDAWSAATEIFTRDTQKVQVHFTIAYYADPKYVTTIFKEVGYEEALAEKIIKPVVLGSIKDAIGQVIADELVAKREVVTKSALAEVKENLLAKHVIVTDLQLTNLNFDDQYEQAVEEKVVAVQQALKAKNDTVTIAEEARQKILSAQADAEAMRIKSEALSKNKGLVSYEAVQKWNGALPQFMFGSGTVPFIDMKSLTTSKQE